MRLCPWSLALASSIPVLGLERFCPRKGCPWPWPWPRIFFVSLALALASSLVSSTPPLVANNIQLCITSQSRKMNNLAFFIPVLDCLFCFCIAKNFIKTGKCRSRGCIPQKNFYCIPPNSSHRYGVSLVLQLATLLNDAFYPRKNVEKARFRTPLGSSQRSPQTP